MNGQSLLTSQFDNGKWYYNSCEEKFFFMIFVFNYLIKFVLIASPRIILHKQNYTGVNVFARQNEQAGLKWCLPPCPE